MKNNWNGSVAGSPSEQKTMCDTLSTAPVITSYYGRPKYQYPNETKISITEPDNGHKIESISKLDFKLESDRLKTFKDYWRSDAVKAEDLAKAGFYFLNKPGNPPDLVKCAFCNAEICSWEVGDDAMQEHLRWSPNCPFVKEHRITPSNGQESGQDVCGNAEILYNSIPESEAFRLLRNMSSKAFEDEKSRLETFKNWSKTSKLDPAALAEAGFYYRGVRDHAICFQCGGALRDWKDDDDTWEQHALWFPKCKFLLAKKGLEYVDSVQRKFKSMFPLKKVTKEEKVCEEEESVSERRSSSDDGILLCKICNLNERNVIFRPCNHILSCDKCSIKFDKCPVCRKGIDERMKVFLS